MDREWMYKRFTEDRRYISREFIDGVVSFVEYACQQSAYMDNDKIRCPCSNCENQAYRLPEDVKLHLGKHGFVKNYYQWVYHGEPSTASSSAHSQTNTSSIGDVEGSNSYRNLVIDAIGHDSNPPTNDNETEPPDPKTQKLYDLLHKADEPLWSGCSKLSQLSTVARLLNIKSEGRITEKVFDDILKLLKDALPSDNKLVGSFYDTKKYAADLGLPCEKIHCCINGCMLYWDKDIDATICKFCKHPPKHMRWHDEHVQTDGEMFHPSDAEAWKHFDRIHPPFALEKRNVRLGLCTDGFQPFGQSGKQYSCWPIIVTPYNLPPWMCMKDPYMFLTIIIPGPKNPKQMLDVYLQPLIVELLVLWKGVRTYDVSKEQNFLMKAALLWTISDFLAYGMLSGWSTSGKKACPYCLDNTKAFSLSNGRKVSWFDCHRQFLPERHPFRRNKNDFIKNRIELSPSPLILTGTEVINQIDDFSLKKVTEIRGVESNASTSKSCVMDIEGKTKDNAKAREDIKIYCKRKVLEKNESIGKYPKACYTLGKEEKKVVCDWVSKLEFPDGYVSNMSRCVDMQKYKMFGMKSHDCHMFMQRLIPMDFRELLPTAVWKVLTELSLFFRDLTYTMLKEEDMIRLHEDIHVILCKLERIFPPGFFDYMEHLLVHLPYEARVGGPIQYR
ncbi:uncharacterized protein Tco_0461011 [Tanacetum coccineum]